MMFTMLSCDATKYTRATSPETDSDVPIFRSAAYVTPVVFYSSYACRRSESRRAEGLNLWLRIWHCLLLVSKGIYHYWKLFLYWLLLVLQGIYHYWKSSFLYLFQAAKANGSEKELVPTEVGTTKMVR